MNERLNLTRVRKECRRICKEIDVLGCTARARFNEKGDPRWHEVAYRLDFAREELKDI